MVSRKEDVTGLPVSCKSEEALAKFNVGIQAYVSLKENPTPLFQAVIELEDDNIIAHCLLGYFLLFGLHAPNDQKVLKHLEAVNKVAVSSLHKRELYYRRSFNTYISNNLLEAAAILQDMLMEYPKDAAGVHLLVRSYIMLGEFPRMRDTLAWILTFWSEDDQFYPYLLAFYSYALEECNEREKAEILAKKALDCNVATPFAYHAMAHVMEETKDSNDSVKFFTKTKENWIDSVYGVHLTWHLCLYYLDLKDTESILHEFDRVIRTKISRESVFGLLDGASLLWRLYLMGVDPGEERWQVVTDAMAGMVHNHQSPWFTSHIMMCMARGKGTESAARLKLAQGMIQSMHAYVAEEGGVTSRKKVYEKLGVPVCNALLAFGQGKYDEVLQIMVPIRHDLVQVGGSWAQRQIFNATMIEAAVRTNNIRTALGLVAELRQRKPKNRTLQELFEKLKDKYNEQGGTVKCVTASQ